MKKISEQDVRFKATKIIDYPGFRQSTKYSCGVSVSQAALTYCFGSKYDKPESDFFKSLKVSEKSGTEPKAIENFLKSKGVAVESAILSVVELKDHITEDHPCIICIQAWGDKKDYTDVYKEGHYVTVIGYNDDGFIFEDPSISARFGFIGYDELDNRWHDIDKNGKKYDHYAIIIKCNKKYSPDKMEVIEGYNMTAIKGYLDYLNEDFSFTSKVFKSNVLKKISDDVKNSIQGNKVDKSSLDKSLKQIPVIAEDRIKNFLAKYIPNFEHNQMLARNYFDKKYPSKTTNDTIATATAIINASNDKKTIQNSIKDVDRVYSRGGNGGGAFVLMLIGIFVTMGAFSFEEIEFKTKAMAIALGALLMIASIKSLGS